MAVPASPVASFLSFFLAINNHFELVTTLLYFRASCTRVNFAVSSQNAVLANIIYPDPSRIIFRWDSSPERYFSLQASR